jgi:PadR family transcriptional regulator PadR
MVNKTARIRELNDTFRRTLSGGHVTLTSGVAALPSGVKAKVPHALIRLTQPALKVLCFLLAGSSQPYSAAAISKKTALGSGTLYPMLARLESIGWLVCHWETINPSEAARPRRRFYRLTTLGKKHARAALADLQLTTG